MISSYLLLEPLYYQHMLLGLLIIIAATAVMTMPLFPWSLLITGGMLLFTLPIFQPAQRFPFNFIGR